MASNFGGAQKVRRYHEHIDLENNKKTLDEMDNDDRWNFQLQYPCKELTTKKSRQKIVRKSVINSRNCLKKASEGCERYNKLDFGLTKSEIDEMFSDIGLDGTEAEVVDKSLEKEESHSTDYEMEHSILDVTGICDAITHDPEKEVCLNEVECDLKASDEPQCDIISTSSGEYDFVIVDAIDETDSSQDDECCDGKKLSADHLQTPGDVQMILEHVRICDSDNPARGNSSEHISASHILNHKGIDTNWCNLDTIGIYANFERRDERLGNTWEKEDIMDDDFIEKKKAPLEIVCDINKYEAEPINLEPLTEHQEPVDSETTDQITPDDLSKSDYKGDEKAKDLDCNFGGDGDFGHDITILPCICKTPVIDKAFKSSLIDSGKVGKVPIVDEYDFNQIEKQLNNNVANEAKINMNEFSENRIDVVHMPSKEMEKNKNVQGDILVDVTINNMSNDISLVDQTEGEVNDLEIKDCRVLQPIENCRENGLDFFSETHFQNKRSYDSFTENIEHSADNLRLPSPTSPALLSQSPPIVMTIREGSPGAIEPPVETEEIEIGEISVCALNDSLDNEVPLDLSICHAPETIEPIKLSSQSHNSKTTRMSNYSNLDSIVAFEIIMPKINSSSGSKEILPHVEKASTPESQFLSSIPMESNEMSAKLTGVLPELNDQAGGLTKPPLPHFIPSPSNEINSSLVQTKSVHVLDDCLSRPSDRLIAFQDDVDLESLFSRRGSDRMSKLGISLVAAKDPPETSKASSGSTSVQPLNKMGSCSYGNIAVVPPRCSSDQKESSKLPFLSPKESGSKSSFGSTDIVPWDILLVPLTEEYEKLVVALGNVATPSVSSLKDRQILKSDQRLKDLTPDASRFIAKQFDRCGRIGIPETADLLKASATLHLVVSTLNSLINCCLPTAANQLRVMTERNKAIIGDELDDAVNCLAELSVKHQEAGIFHPKVIKLSEILRDYLEDHVKITEEDCGEIRGTILLLESDYANSLGKYLCDCIASLHKEFHVILWVPATFDDLNFAAEELRARLSSHTILISVPTLVPVVKVLTRRMNSSMQLLLIEYSHSGNMAFGDEDLTCESRIVCMSLRCQVGDIEYGRQLPEDSCLKLRDVLLTQNHYTFITSQEFIQLPDVLFSLESKHKVTLVERSYSEMNLKLSYCDVLIDHENGVLVEDILFLNNDEEVEKLLVRIRRLSSNLSRSWVVFYNFSSSLITTNFVSNYYNLLAVGTMVSSICSEYQVKFLCCKSLDCLPLLIRQIGDMVHKNARETSKTDSLPDEDFITADMTKHEMILLAFPCFNSMSAQLLLRSKNLISLMSASLAELQKEFPEIPSRVFQMFLELRRSSSQMYKQLKQTSVFLNELDGPDYDDDHCLDETMNDLTVASNAVHDSSFFETSNFGENAFSMNVQNGATAGLNIYTDSFSSESENSNRFFRFHTYEPTKNRLDYSDQMLPVGGSIHSAGRLYREADYLNYRGSIGSSNKNPNEARLSHPSTAYGRRMAIEASVGQFGNYHESSLLRGDVRSQSSDFDLLSETKRNTMDYNQFDLFWGYNPDSQVNGFETIMNWNRPSMEYFKIPNLDRRQLSDINRSSCGKDRSLPTSAMHDISIGGSHEVLRKDSWLTSLKYNDVYEAKEKERKLTYEPDCSLKNGQTRLKFI